MQINSQSWGAFNENMKEIDRLMSIHVGIAGGARGRKYGVEVLNKAAIILLTACWEAFVEDLCSRAALFLISAISKSSNYPLSVRIQLAKSIRADRDERRVWNLADEGWKNELLEHARRSVESLNTPRAKNVDDLFNSVLGMERLSRAWKWQGTSCDIARAKIDKLISLRGSLAHRANAGRSITKSVVLSHKAHVSLLVEKSTFATASFLREIIGTSPTRTVLL